MANTNNTASTSDTGNRAFSTEFYTVIVPPVIDPNADPDDPEPQPTEEIRTRRRFNDKNFEGIPRELNALHNCYSFVFLIQNFLVNYS